MDYDKDLYSEIALQLLEGDIQFWSKRYHVPGYEYEDLCQEGRLKLYKALRNYNPFFGVSFRTWANSVIKNHFRDLLRSSNYNCRKCNDKTVELNDFIPDPKEPFEDIIEVEFLYRIYLVKVYEYLSYIHIERN